METTKAKILIGSPVRVDPQTFQAHLESLKWQELPPNVEVQYHHVINDPEPGPLKAQAEELGTAEVVPTVDFSVDSTHHWNKNSFDLVASIKQNLLDQTVEQGFSHFFLVDSDILLDRRCLASLLSVERPIVSGVFWTAWEGSEPTKLGPNVWLRNPYFQEGFGMNWAEFWRRLVQRRLTRVAGGGAVCLFQREALEKDVRYFPRLDGLPSGGMWQGEDRSLSLRAQRNHVKQYADPWPDIFHAYHPEDRTPETLEAALEMLGTESQALAKYGDLVNFALEPLAGTGLETEFKVYPVRGRLGSLDLLPEVEAALLEMSPGQERIMTIRYPTYWPDMVGNEAYARLRLIDVKPYGFHPVFAEQAMENIQ